MKKLHFIYTLIAIFFYIAQAKGQNVPDGSSNPGYNASALSINAYSTPAKVNFLRSWKPMVPVTDTTSWALNAPANYSVATVYLNGFGQNLQTNFRGTTSPDRVTVGMPRPSSSQIGFLPFTATAQSHFLTNPVSAEQSYYTTNYASEQGGSYSKTESYYYNNIFTQRSFQPGAAFVGQSKGQTVRTVFNDTDLIWKFNDITTYPHKDGYYDAGTLTVKVITDSTPDNKQQSSAREYYDRDDRMVCKRVSYGKHLTTGKDLWLTTYYVYNDKGLLTYIIPPKVDPQANTNMFLVMMNGLCYKYVYDKYNNIIQKIVPNKTGSELTVYDRKHRPVLFQSPLLAERHQWYFNIYDSRGRVVMSGITTINNSQANWTYILDVASVTPDGSLIDYLVNECHGNYTFSIPNCDVQVLNYYDNYDHGNGISNHPFSSIHNSYYMTGTGIVTPEPYMLTQGLLTASRTRVMDYNIGNSDTGDFANNYELSVYHYDKKARLIQSQTLNPWNAPIAINDHSNWDVATAQYNFAGQKVAEMVSHFGMPNSVKPTTFLQKRYYYDLENGGRLTSISQNVDNTAWMNIASYTYDNLGRVSRKNLGNIEAQNYTYNIRGQLRSINEAYTVSATNPNSDITFGCILGYDYGFINKRYDGKIAGYFWRGSGTSKMKAYGYHYDLAGRTTHAEFREYVNPSSPNSVFNMTWNKSRMDYTAANMQYDANSNLLTMDQRGVAYMNPGYQIKDIDKLVYYYTNDRLTSVRDYVTADYHLGDFINKECTGGPGGGPEENPGPEYYMVGGDSLQQDPADTAYIAQALLQYNNNSGMGNDNPPYDPGSELDPPQPPPACADYRYDKNGNLIYDLNKGITAINYNHQDLPLQVFNTAGDDPGDIKNTYDAGGSLLRKSIKHTTTGIKDSFEYWGPFVYKNQVLQYILHNEGRTRWDETSGKFDYDYFVKDHLGNVRNTVTAKAYDPILYAATHEIAVANLEASIFDNIDEVRSGNPNPGPSNTMAIELHADDSTKRIGTAMLLKVMAGDNLEIDASSFYEDDTLSNQPVSPANMLSSLFGILATGVNPVGGTEGQNIQTIFNSFDPNNFSTAYQSLLDEETDSTEPTAYLNYVAFDNQFNMLTEYSKVIQVHGPISQWQNMNLNDLNVMTNGYALIFLSNSSRRHVFFDQLRIHFYRGHLIQEQHYYPYGLAVNLGQAPDMPNKFQYQGKLMQDELGLNLYDFHARQYDPQIGRFWGIDPLDQFPNGYTGMGSDPANNVDPTGMATTTAKPDGPVQPEFINVPDGTNGEGPFLYNKIFAQVSIIAQYQEDLRAQGLNTPTGSVENVIAKTGVNDEETSKAIESPDVLTAKANDIQSRKNVDKAGDQPVTAPDDDEGQEYDIKKNRTFGSGGNKEDNKSTEAKKESDASTAFHYVGPLMMFLGIEWKHLKPYGAAGSKAGSSIASYGLTRLTKNRQYKTHKFTGFRTKTGGAAGYRVTTSKTVGRVLGRYVPLVGEVFFYYDFYKTVAVPMAEGMSNYQMENTENGNWISNLPH